MDYLQKHVKYNSLFVVIVGMWYIFLSLRNVLGIHAFLSLVNLIILPFFLKQINVVHGDHVTTGSYHIYCIMCYFLWNSILMLMLYINYAIIVQCTKEYVVILQAWLTYLLCHIYYHKFLSMGSLEILFSMCFHWWLNNLSLFQWDIFVANGHL